VSINNLSGHELTEALPRTASGVYASVAACNLFAHDISQSRLATRSRRRRIPPK